MNNADWLSAQPKARVTADQEVWLQNLVESAMKMAIQIHRLVDVRAHEPLKEYGLRGLAEGATEEIIRTLGMEPEYVNIRKPRWMTKNIGTQVPGMEMYRRRQ